MSKVFSHFDLFYQRNLSNALFFYCIGIHARNHSLEKREQYFLSQEDTVLKNHKLVQQGLVYEIVTLSTCNRIEHYIVTKKPLTSILNTFFNPIPKHIYFFKGKEASYHLFYVAAGLDSQILGENEILSQVKRTYLRAHSYGLTAKYLNTLFQKAIALGKKVRSCTKISKYSLSTFGIIFQKIKNYFRENTLETHILLIGIGDMAQSIALSLWKKGFKNLFICNKKQSKGLGFAQRMNLGYIAEPNLQDNLDRMQVIISSTSSPNLVIHQKSTIYWKNQTKLLIDLAVPRDIDPSIPKNKPHIHLFNIDQILDLSQQHLNKRHKAIHDVEKIVALENENYYWKRLFNMKANPLPNTDWMKTITK